MKVLYEPEVDATFYIGRRCLCSCWLDSWSVSFSSALVLIHLFIMTEKFNICVQDNTALWSKQWLLFLFFSNSTTIRTSSLEDVVDCIVSTLNWEKACQTLFGQLILFANGTSCWVCTVKILEKMGIFALLIRAGLLIARYVQTSLYCMTATVLTSTLQPSIKQF